MATKAATTLIKSQRTAAQDRRARRLRRQEGPHQRRPQLRAVRAHLPRPARRRRRLRGRHRRRGPRADHLGRPDQQDPAHVDRPRRVRKGRATTVARQQVDKAATAEPPAWSCGRARPPTSPGRPEVTGRDHGQPLDPDGLRRRPHRQVPRPARSASPRAPATATGRHRSPSRPRGSGSTYSMTNSNATTLKCQNASGNVTFTGTDDVWGNGVATDRETGCVDAFYSAEKERQMLSAWLGRNGMNGSGGWVPIRVGLNDVNAYYDGTQVQIGHTPSGDSGSAPSTSWRTSSATASTTTRPGGISGGGTQEFVARHLRRRHRVVRQQPGRPPRLPRRRGGQPGRPRPDPQHVQPVGRSATRTATPARSRTPRSTRQPARATTGSTCWPRAPARPTASPPARPATARRSPASASRPPSGSCTTRC